MTYTQRVYAKEMDVDSADALFRGASHLTIGGTVILTANTNLPCPSIRAMISVGVEGDRYVYTGIAERLGEPSPLKKGRNLVTLTFTLGDEQSYLPLSAKLTHYGFSLRE